MLGAEIRHPGRLGSRIMGAHSPAVIQRVFSHDVYHIAELNETLGVPGRFRARPRSLRG